MNPNNNFYELSNLYIPNHCHSIKFGIFEDLTPYQSRSNPVEEEDKHIDTIPFGICDAVKNSNNYKELLSTFNVQQLENFEAFLMVKKKLEPEKLNLEIADNFQEEILSLNDRMRTDDNSDRHQETEVIFLWRTTKLSLKLIATKTGTSNYFVRNTIKSYKKNVKALLLMNKVNSNKLRTVVSQQQIAWIAEFWKTRSNIPIYLPDIINKIWPKSNKIDPPSNTTVSKVLRTKLRMSYRTLRPAPKKTANPEHIRTYWEAVMLQCILEDWGYELIFIDEFSISHRDTKLQGWSF